MSSKSPIIVVSGEPNSVFLEIFFKSIKKKIESPLILISSFNIVKTQMKKFKHKFKINIITKHDVLNKNLNNMQINLIDIYYDKSKKNNYISNCFNVAFEILKKHKLKKFINGPINKKNFLNKNYLGMTEYISEKFNIKNNAMLIYNKELSVCPITTHLPLKQVSKKITKKLITEKVKMIKNFYKYRFKMNPKIAVTGLNPHCESISKFNEDEKIIKPLVINLKKNYSISGPYAADTIFLKQNRKKYDVILGMYHDQVLTPIKTLFEYDAINITLGLPFLRISPDHGPNEKMVGKNISNPLSLIKAILFLDKN